jgi:hypothetical protein
MLNIPPARWIHHLHVESTTCMLNSPPACWFHRLHVEIAGRTMWSTTRSLFWRAPLTGSLLPSSAVREYSLSFNWSLVWNIHVTCNLIGKNWRIFVSSTVCHWSKVKSIRVICHSIGQLYPLCSKLYVSINYMLETICISFPV